MKEGRLLLDQYSYTEAMLKTTWRCKTNQDITASIVGVLTRCWAASRNKCCKPLGSAAAEGGLIAST